MLGGVLVGALQWHAEQEQRRAILALTLDERQALLERTRRTLEALCPNDVLARQCEAEARLLLLIPECDARCRRMAAESLPRATR